jgi:drug/metabolite transporter (DMT)-like permease
MAIFGKLAYSAGVTPSALLLLRFTLAAALLAGLLVLQPGLRAVPAGAAPRSGRAGVTGPLVLTGLGLGAVGFATQAVLYFEALERIDASLVVLVLYTYPLLVTVAAALLGRDRLTPGRVGALVLASCGTLLVLLGAGGTSFDLVGVALAFGSAVTYTGYILVADTVVHRLPPVVLAALVMTGASLTLGTGPSTAAIVSTFEPVVTTALAALTLDEFLTPVHLGGALVVLSSAAVVQLRRRQTLLVTEHAAVLDPSSETTPLAEGVPA